MDSQFPFKTTSIIVCYGYIFSRVHVFRSCVAVGCFRGTNQCVGFFLIVLLIHRISSFCFLKVSRLCSCSYLYFFLLYTAALIVLLLFSVFCSLCYSLFYFSQFSVLCVTASIYGCKIIPWIHIFTVIHINIAPWLCFYLSLLISSLFFFTSFLCWLVLIQLLTYALVTVSHPPHGPSVSYFFPCPHRSSNKSSCD